MTVAATATIKAVSAAIARATTAKMTATITTNDKVTTQQ